MSEKSNHVCYLCFSENYNLLGKNPDFGSEIYQCNSCGLIQSDFVSGGYLDVYYRRKYREDRKEVISDKYLDFMSARARSQRNFIVNNIPSSFKINKIVDIGAGAGKLLESFLPEAEVFGVESDLAMAKHIANHGRITLLDQGALFGQKYVRYFDLVTLSHVFEHLNNPLEYLYRLHKVISGNGFVFLEVPNESVRVVTHYINKKQRGIGHLFNYTVDTLRLVIDKSCLFDVLALKTYSISVSDYIGGGSINNFEENSYGDGIHIRCLLKKREGEGDCNQYRYIDAVLQNFYRQRLLDEQRERLLVEGIDRLGSGLLKVKDLIRG